MDRRPHRRRPIQRQQPRQRRIGRNRTANDNEDKRNKKARTRMFDYLKTLYQSMKYASYYKEVADNTPRNQVRDELAQIMSIRF
jgi:hypothetical protein